MNQTKTPYVYRVQITDKKNNSKQYLAHVVSDSDENARRKIIHQTIREEGLVKTIASTVDKARQPGDSRTRYYK